MTDTPTDTQPQTLYYFVDEAAAELGVSTRQIRWLAAKYHVGQHIRNMWVFSPDDLDTLRQRNTQVGRPPSPTARPESVRRRKRRAVPPQEAPHA